jgi:Ca2+-dependent lipid-binding protein
LPFDLILPKFSIDSGVLRFTVHECKELGGAQKSGGISIPVIGGKNDISPYAVVKVNGKERLRTQPFKRSINPRWDKQIEVFVTDKTQLKLNVDILDSSFDERVLGRWASALEKFEEDVFIDNQDWWTLKDGAGKIHLSMQWKPISMTGFVEGLSQGTYRPPIGVVRVDFEGANDLKNVEAMTGGKSDPYVRIMSGVQNRGQTEHIDDNLDPVWNQVLYVPVHSKREDLILEVMDYNDVQKDKSLGITDLLLKDIMKEVKTEDGQVIYESLETVARAASLTGLDRKKGRGTLKFKASFFPTLALAKEDKKKEEQRQEEESNNSQVSEEPELIEKPKEFPEKDLHGELIKYKAISDDKKFIDFSAYESGVLAVTMHTLAIPESQKIVADLMLDSNDSQFTTSEQKGSSIELNETGTAFIKEMDFSKLMIRVRNVRDGEKDDKAIGRVSLEVRKVVERLARAAEDDTITEPVIEEISLLDCPGGKIRLSFAFIPVVQFKLDPSESLENQGNLTVTVVKCSGLVAADRGGTSDPFIRFYVDEQRVYKTQTYKKTLNPIFNKDETFTVPIVNRTVTPVVAKVFDWDQIGKDTLLGTCAIKFTSEEVETFVTSTKEYKLDQGGTITLRLTWRPELVARKRTNTSLFSATTRVFTSAPGNALGAGQSVVGAGLGAGGKVLGAGGKVFGSGVSALGSGIRGFGKIGKKSPTVIEENPSSPPVIPLDREVTSSSSASTPAAEAAVSPVPTQSSTIANDNSSILSTSPSNSVNQLSRSVDNEGVSVQVTLIEARGLKAMDRGGTSDPYCRVRVGSKQVFKTRHIKKTLTPDWNESFTTRVKGIMDFKVKDYNTITDVDIGDHQFDVSSFVKPGQPFDGWLPLSPEGTGEIHVKISMVDTDAMSVTSKSGLFGKK